MSGNVPSAASPPPQHDGDEPVLSVIMATHDRPRFLPMALSCYARQTYPHRELIVVDDSLIPIDDSLVAAVGGRVLRMEPGTPLGTKLNRGIADARGILCQKMDDDDWYSPHFLARMVRAAVTEAAEVCSPTLTFLVSFLFFDLARWELRRNAPYEMSGATLLFSVENWRDSPFRDITGAEDVWFIEDQRKMGSRLLAVLDREDHLVVRHSSHLWTEHRDRSPLDDYMRGCPLHEGGPEAVLDADDVRFYERLRRHVGAPGALPGA